MADFDDMSHLWPTERIGIFIDGANLSGSARALEMSIDFKILRELFVNKAHLVQAFYYTAISEEYTSVSVRRLINWLEYNGYFVVTKPTKAFMDDDRNWKVKGNMDIELAVDAMEVSSYLDHIVLVSGDGDFRYLVSTLQKRGKRVTVISTARTRPPMIADSLRRQADFFVELDDIRGVIGRPIPSSVGNVKVIDDSDHQGDPQMIDDDHHDEEIDDFYESNIGNTIEPDPE